MQGISEEGFSALTLYILSTAAVTPNVTSFCFHFDSDSVPSNEFIRQVLKRDKLLATKM